MSERLDWGQRVSMAQMKNSLNDTVPEMKSYLRPGLKVLDVGCGPGSLTLDVANAVDPGEVIGIDHLQMKVDTACRLAEERKVGNASFQIGDTYNLDFPDDTFDVVFSHNVLHQLIDPVKALSEQRRVAKKGGWVIAAGVRDYGLSPRYPKCPTVEKALEGFTRYNQSSRERYESGEHTPTTHQQGYLETDYFDLQAGRRCPEWFSKAGLVDLNIRVKAFRVEYPGADDMEIQNIDGLPPLDEPENAYLQMYRKVFAAGFLDEDTLARARRELIDWYRHPHAFHFYAFVFAAGRT